MQFAAGILMFIIMSWMFGMGAYALVGKESDDNELFVGMGILVGIIILFFMLINL